MLLHFQITLSNILILLKKYESYEGKLAGGYWNQLS